MRKIKSALDIEKTQRRNATIMGIVFITLLVLSTAGFAIMSSDKESENVKNENGFDFVRDGGMWKLRIGEEVFGFQNLPSEVSDIEVDLDIQLGQYSGQPVYFVNSREGVSEILGNIGKYVLRYQEACLQRGLVNEAVLNKSFGGLDNATKSNEEKCTGDLPIKDCSSNLIIFNVGNETRVYNEENCVFIEGDVLRGSDAFLFKLLGIN